MYFVYYGYVDPDNYDASNGPVYKLVMCVTTKEVLELKERHEQGLDSESSNPIFRVIEGVERNVVKKETVVSWKIV